MMILEWWSFKEAKSLVFRSSGYSKWTILFEGDCVHRLSPTLVPVSALKTCAYLAANIEFKKMGTMHHTTGLN